MQDSLLLLTKMRQRRQCPVPSLLLRVVVHALCLVALLLRDDGALALSLSPYLTQQHTTFSSTAKRRHQSSSPSLCTMLAKRTNNKDDSDAVFLPFLSRRDAVWKIPLGVGFAYGYGKLVSQVVANTIRGTIYPEAHESRVRSTIEQTLLAAAASAAVVANRRSRTLRVLEVGIGNEARILRRGLYEPALQQLASSSSSSSSPSSSSSFIQRVELTGLDIQLPSAKIQQQVQQEQQTSDGNIIPMDVAFVQQSVEDISFAADGYFDAIVCCLTLCSVDNPLRAVQEMQRVLNPRGGTMGFVEHVAVNLEDESSPAESSFRFLEWQQRFFDPVQQLVADNCHLHRSTQETIYNVMGVVPNENSKDRDVGSSSSSSRATVLNEERFLVDAMWPVSMQCCGVLQRLS